MFLFAKDTALLPMAREIATRFGLELTGSVPPETLHLSFSDDGLALCRGTLSVRGDFRDFLLRIRKENLPREMLVKAAKPKSYGEEPTLLDATAGLGEDSFILAAAGFRVMLCEYDPVIAALLFDALRRAKEDSGLSGVASRMELFFGNSIEQMKHLSSPVDVILLDPMFPKRQKSGLIKKKFQLLQQLESPSSTENDLFLAAASAHPKKVIVKRPVKGEYLTGKKPSYEIAGSVIRYDCYVFSETERRNTQ